MELIGIFLILVGGILNLRLLRGPLSQRQTAGQIFRSWPWLTSVGIAAVGVALLLLSGGNK